MQAKQQVLEHKEAPIEVNMDQAYDTQFSKTLEISPPNSFNQYEMPEFTSGLLLKENQKMYDVNMA